MKYYICQLDQQVNKGKNASLDTALRNVLKYIQKQIDDTFPEREFMDWVDSDSTKAFKWNRNRFYWEEAARK